MTDTYTKPDASYTLPYGFHACDENAYLIVQSFIDECNHLFEAGYDDRPERIENASCDGFFPYTQGGWLAMVMSDAGRAIDPSWAAPLAHAWAVERESDAYKTYEIDKENGHDFDQDEYVWDWLATSSFFYVIEVVYYSADNWRKDCKHDVVTIRAGLNFDEYGRDGRTQWLYEKDVTPAQLAKCPVAAAEAIGTSIADKINV